MTLEGRCLIGIIICMLGASSHAAEPAIFEHQVAPILERRCVTCHNEHKRKGGLSLADASSAIAGGESGPVIRSGDAKGSRLIEMISGPDAKMPKKGEPLTTDQIDAIRQWIDAGAEWPADRKLVEKSVADETWWSLQPVVRPELPVLASSWGRNPIDAFTLARLKENGLQPAPEADRRALIRRLSFDLIGLPPAPEEVEAFVNDSRPDAYEQLVDRLLESPRFGERWARHWLDVVHYADSHGFERDRPRPQAWPYRDYVIRSFNADKPYDRFLREQIAGDAVAPDDPDAIVATGYLAAGPFDLVSRAETRNPELNFAARVEELDDIVTTVMTSTMALTINCARCHDHKFDPIDQEEYFRLTAVFAGTHRADNGDRTERPINAAANRELAQQRTELTEQLRAVDAQLGALGEAPIDLADIVGGGGGFGDGQRGYGVDPRTGKIEPAGKRYLNDLKPNALVKVDHPYIDGVVTPDGGPNADAVTPISSTGITVQLPDTSGASWDYVTHGKIQSQHSTVLGKIDYDTPDHSLLGLHANKAITFDLDAIRRKTGIDAMRFQATVGFGGSDGPYTAAYRVFVDGKQVAGMDGLRRSTPPIELDLPIDPSSRFLTLVGTDDTGDLSHTQVFFGDAQLALIRAEAQNPESAEAIAKLTAERERLRRAIEGLKDQSVRMVYTVESVAPSPTHLLERGQASSPTHEVLPGALRAITALDPDLATGETGDLDRRRALAEWITDRNNPLTSRVIVNRLWQWHFGRGIVDTPSDFGANGGRPTHPALLDWLADELVASGWSLKHIHRLIVTSSTYRQSAQSNADALAVDAGNRLLWRASLRRLEAEAIRDAMLAVSGSLNLEMGGPGFRDFRYVDKYAPEYHHVTHDRPEFWRRSIYRFVVRSVPNRFMKVLDAPDPSILTATRGRTTTALQALTLFNNPFVIDQAERTAVRIQNEVGDDPRAQADRLYRLAVARTPSDAEADAATKLIETQGLAQMCRLMFNSNEFLYVE